jgi:hypothetical protein
MTNKDLIKKYIEPNVWIGSVKVDGGWGNKQKLHKYNSEDPALYVDSDMIFSPISDSIKVPSNKIDSDPVNFVTVNERYYVAFVGKNYKKLLQYINEVGKLCEECVWELQALDKETNKPGTLRITILKEKDKHIFKVLEGQYSPDFSNPKTIAGWSE